MAMPPLVLLRVLLSTEKVCVAYFIFILFLFVAFSELETASLRKFMDNL
jgi:hypothetical protein